MKDSSFQKVVNLLQKMDNFQIQRLSTIVSGLVNDSSVLSKTFQKVYQESKYNSGLNCPHCKNTKVVKHGKAKYKKRESQRYKCKVCLKTFTNTTLTPLQKIHDIDGFFAFIECMFQGESLRKSSKKIGVPYGTLFYWRHKILSALQQMPPEHFKGILEMDETYFLHSEKGSRSIVGRNPRKRGGSASLRGISNEQVCVFVARDRQKTTFSRVTCRGRIQKKQVENSIGDLISPNTILCTDSWRGFSSYAKQKSLKHYRVKPDKGIYVIKEIYHIQNVNNYHHRYKDWLAVFNGVATKYMNNYLSWFKYLDAIQFELTFKNQLDLLLNICVYGKYYSCKSITNTRGL